jgi:hypothetical protein
MRTFSSEAVTISLEKLSAIASRPYYMIEVISSLPFVMFSGIPYLVWFIPRVCRNLLDGAANRFYKNRYVHPPQSN